MAPDSITIPLGELPTPPLLGFANHWAIRKEDWFWELQFQYRRGASATVVLSIVIGIDDLASLMGSIPNEVLAKDLALFTDSGIALSPATEFIEDAPPPSLVHIGRLTRSGLDGVMEFYAADAYALAQYKDGKRRSVPKMTPVGAVQAPTVTMLGLFQEAKADAAQLKARIEALKPGVV